MSGPIASIHPALRRCADGYVSAGPGLHMYPLPRVTTATRDAAFHARCARVYDGAPRIGFNPLTADAYAALVRELRAQAEALHDAGFRWTMVMGDPYPDSAHLLRDAESGSIRVLTTDPAHPHPLLTVEHNNLFRAVHDWFGHVLDGNTFGPVGEENAYRTHARMFSPLARRAMATETRGANSWFNDARFGKGTTYAEQKAFAFPAHLCGGYPTSLGGILR